MSAVAHRYAKALFSLAKEAGTLQPTADELARTAAVAADNEIGPVLASPLLAAPKRRAITESLIRELNLSDLLSRFLRLLADQQRLAALPSIADEFGHLLDAELGRVRVSIRSATALTAQQQADIVDKFAQLTHKQVIPKVSVEPDLLGGVVVEVAGKVYDGSIRNQLDRLAAQLSGPSH